MLENLKKTINESLQYVSTHEENPIQLIYKIFSDNILIVRPISNNGFSEFELHSMIKSIAHYQ